MKNKFNINMNCVVSLEKSKTIIVEAIDGINASHKGAGKLQEFMTELEEQDFDIEDSSFNVSNFNPSNKEKK